MCEARAFWIVLASVLVLTALTTVGNAQTYSVLYNFGTTNGDPLSPEGGLVQGRDGNVYGVSGFGGANGQGTVFKITSGGVTTVLHSFQEQEVPDNRLTLGTDGNLYGTTEQGGSSGFGTVFKITPAGVLKVLWNFTNGSDGGYPMAPPVQGEDGKFYGTASTGGNLGYGTVCKLTPSGSLTTIYQFDSTHGAVPETAFVQGIDGNFYGSTFLGGVNGFGTIFKITAAGKLTVLYNLIKKFTGYNILSPLIQGNDGYFYGTAFNGGPSTGGTVFKIKSVGKFIVLHDFSNPDGTNPYGGLVQATNGNLYGVTAGEGSHHGGTIYQITTNGSFSVLYNFDSTDGFAPYTTLLQRTDGKLYGDTTEGGGTNEGVFYSFDLGLGSFVSLVSTSGKVGKIIGILGQPFKGTTSVSFNGTPASFTVESDTYLTATVPDGATTGPVTVTTPGGLLTSNRTFRVR